MTSVGPIHTIRRDDFKPAFLAYHKRISQLLVGTYGYVIVRSHDGEGDRYDAVSTSGELLTPGKAIRFISEVDKRMSRRVDRYVNVGYVEFRLPGGGLMLPPEENSAWNQLQIVESLRRIDNRAHRIDVLYELTQRDGEPNTSKVPADVLKDYPEYATITPTLAKIEYDKLLYGN